MDDGVALDQVCGGAAGGVFRGVRFYSGGRCMLFVPVAFASGLIFFFGPRGEELDVVCCVFFVIFIRRAQTQVSRTCTHDTSGRAAIVAARCACVDRVRVCYFPSQFNQDYFIAPQVAKPTVAAAAAAAVWMKHQRARPPPPHRPRWRSRTWHPATWLLQPRKKR